MEILKGLKLKKKVIVIASVLVALLGIILILAFTVFSLKSVEVDFRTSRLNITASQEEIIENSGIKKGGSVFFKGKRGYIEKIEDVNPYINVINIETVFPSKFVIHITERQEIYALPFENGHYICDEELRVLRIDEAYQNTTSNAVVLNTVNPTSQNDLQAGDYITDVTLPPIYEALFENNCTLGEMTEIVEEITFTSEKNTTINKEQTVATLSLYSGQTVRIVNAEYGLVSKVKLMLDVYSQLFEFIGKTIKTGDGEVVLTEKNLKSCTIEINNYLHPDRTENECYFDLILN